MSVADVAEKNLEQSEAQTLAVNSIQEEVIDLNTAVQQVDTTLTQVATHVNPENEDTPTPEEKPAFWLKRLFGLESQTQREAREARREDARKQDRGKLGAMFLGKQKDKKGGLFGLLGGIGRMLGGTFTKIIGPLWKVLKVLFKVLKFTALGAALIAGGIFFSMSASDQQKTIDSVMAFFKKVGEVLSSLGKAFGAAFMKNMDDMTDEEGNPIEGLVTKFGKFKDAWKGVLDKLSRVSLTVGGKTYKGLEGFASMMGDLFGKIAGWFLDLGTGIATLITDPALVWLKLKISVMNFFGSIGDAVGRFADKFLNLEFLISMLPEGVQTVIRAAGWIQDASESRAEEKLKEMRDLAAREKVLAAREKDVKETFDKQQAKVDAIDAELNNDKIKLSAERRKALEAEKEVEDQKRLNAMRMHLEAKNERERNVDRFEYAKESYEASTETAVRERANAIVKQKAGIDVIKIEEEIAELQENRKDLMSDTVGGDSLMWGEIDKSLSTFQDMRDMFKGKEKITKDDLTPDMIKKLGIELGLTSDQADSTKLINKFLAAGVQREKDIAEQEKGIADIRARSQAKIDKFMPDAMKDARAAFEKEQGGDVPILKPVKTTHTGGIISESGIIGAQKGEIIVDDILVNTFVTAAEAMSGMSLMNLQRDQSAAVGTGAPIIISNAPSTQVNQNQAMILPPSPIQPGNSDAPRLLN